MFGVCLLRLRLRLAWYAFEHFNAYFACCDFTQCCYCRLVAGLYTWRMALAEHAGAVGCSEYELEAVRDLGEAVFNGDAGHAGNSSW